MSRTSTRIRFNAVLFAAVMVLSMVAMGAAAAGPSAPDNSEIIADGSSADLDAAALEANEEDEEAGADSGPAEIDPALEDGEGETHVLVALESDPAIEGLTGDDLEAALKAQAEATQGPVVNELSSMDGVEVTGEFWIVNMVTATIDLDTVDVSQLAGVETVTGVYESQELEIPEPVEVDEVSPEFGEKEYTYGLEQINAPDAWDSFGTQGEGSTVAIMDGGVEEEHDDIEVAEQVAIDNDGGVHDDDWIPHYHGTHVASTIVGTDASGTQIGVAPEADLYVADIFAVGGQDGSVVGAIEWAVEEDADVLSGSIGFGCAGFTPQPGYIDSLIEPIENAYDMGTIVQSSAGNGGEGCVSGLGNDFGTFSIGASDETEAIAEFSSGGLIDKDEGQEDWPAAGAWDDPPEHWPQHWITPEVSAPGVDVWGADLGNTYAALSGTSMSAPHVAGAIGLLTSENPDATPDELMDILEETAWKPDDWDEDEARWTDEDSEHDQPGVDSRYGMGIIDVEAAMGELGEPTVDFLVLGDVTQTGEVGLDDAILIEEHIVCDCDLGEYNEQAADMNRDGHVTLTDAILVQEKLVGSLDAAHLTVDDVSTPEELPEGDELTVEADLTNHGDEGAIQTVHLHLAPEGAEFDENTSVANTSVDMATEGVVDPVVFGHEHTVEFSVDTTGFEGGSYDLAVMTEDEEQMADFHITREHFNITELSAPDERDDGEIAEVEATIENEGDANSSQEIDLVFDGEVVDTQELFLNVSEDATVTFDMPVEDISEGTYDIGVETENDAATVEMDVWVPFFDVTDIDAPLMSVEEVDVAVVGAGIRAEETLDRLDAALDDDDYNVEYVDDGEYLDEIDEYDVFVFNDFGFSPDPLDEFMDQRADHQGVLFLENDGTGSDAISELADIRDDLEVDDSGFGADEAQVEYDILEDHDIFDGVGTIGDQVMLYEEDRWAWFTGYDGDVIADLHAEEHEGAGVGINEDENEILLASMGSHFSVSEDAFTEDANTTFAQAVKHVSPPIGDEGVIDHGETYTVNGTFENLGGADGIQTVGYALSDDTGLTPVDADISPLSTGASIAVVGSGVDPNAEDTEILTEEAIDRDYDGIVTPKGAEDIADELSDRLDHEIDTVPDDQFLDVIDDYDVFVFHDFGTNADSLEDFMDQREDQGIVFLEQWGTGSDAISELANLRDDLEVDTALDSANPPTVHYEILEGHSVFDGIGGVGDNVELYEESDWAWFTGYDGEVIADLHAHDTEGAGLGINEDENEVLLASMGRTTWVPNDAYTDDANDILANSVETVLETMVTEDLELASGESGTVEFEFTVPDTEPLGVTNHVVASQDDVETAPAAIDSPERIEITEFDTPAEVMQGEEFDVNVTVEHMRDELTTQDLSFAFDETVVDSEEITLDEGENTTVSLTHEVDLGFDPGDVELGAAVDWNETSTTIEVIEADDPDFQMSDVELPPTGYQGQNSTATATVTNVGDLSGEQTVTWEILKEEDQIPGLPPDDPDDPDVDGGIAVVDDARHMEHGEDLADILEDHMDDTEVDVITESDLMNQVHEYEIFVIQRFNSDALADDFLDELTTSQGVVYMDSHQGASSEQYPDGVYRLHNVRDDPGEWDSESLGTDTSAAEVTITDDHPIFDGVGDAGDTVTLNEDTSTWGSWFDDYSGDVIADVDYSPTDPGVYAGPGIGVNDAENEVLLNALSHDFFSDRADITEDGELVLVNAVQHVAMQADGAALVDGQYIYPTDSHDFDESALDAESADELEIQPSSYDLVHTVELDLELEGGESDEIELDWEVPLNQKPGQYEQTLSTDDDSADDELEIRQTDANIGISAYFLDPDPDEEDLIKGENLSAEAVVINDGDRTGELNVQLFDGEDVIDSETVEVDPDDVKIVELEGELENAGERIISVNGVDPIKVDVLEPANFAVTDLDAPDDVDEGEEIEVDFEIMNTGDIDDTQDIVFEVDGEEEDVLSDETLAGGETLEDTFTYETADDGEDAPEVSVTVSTDDDSDSATVTVNEAANFAVVDLDAPDDVDEGEEIEVDFEIENTGDQTDTQDIVFEVDGEEEDVLTDETLEGGETLEDTFTYETADDGEDAPEVSVTVSTDDDSDSATVTVNEPANFAVTIDETNSPVEAGEDLDVDVTVENTGDQSDEQTIELEDFDGESVDSATVELDGGAEESLTLTWETEEGDDGEDNITVSSDDDSDTTMVEIQEPPEPAHFAVTIDETNSPVEAGEDLDVDVTVENTGDQSDEQTIELEDFDGVSVDNASVELDGGENESLTLTWATEEGDDGDGEITVSSDDDTASESVEIQEANGNGDAASISALSPAVIA